MTPSNEKAAGGGAVERKLFEKTLRARGYCYFDGKLMGLSGDQVWEYMSAGTEHAWKGWQASRTDAESALKLQADRIAELEGALEQIDNWSRAYPLDVFPEPTSDQWAMLHAAAKSFSPGIDRFSASNMRHVVTSVGEIARAALSKTA